MKGKYAISSRCTSCHKCVKICPTAAIYPGTKQYVIDADACTGCAVCVPICPEDAIHLVGEALESGSTS